MKELDACFKEFKDEIKECEFIGCTHIKELKCGIKRAIKDEKITKERYENYCKIYEELKDREKHRW